MPALDGVDAVRWILLRKGRRPNAEIGIFLELRLSFVREKAQSLRGELITL